VADLDHALQTYELGFVHLVASEQFGVVTEVAQEPVQLPQGFRGAVESARQEVSGKPAGLENDKTERLGALHRLSPVGCCVPASTERGHRDCLAQVLRS
jgi:hypothetical protein